MIVIWGMVIFIALCGLVESGKRHVIYNKTGAVIIDEK